MSVHHGVYPLEILDKERERRKSEWCEQMVAEYNRAISTITDMYAEGTFVFAYYVFAESLESPSINRIVAKLKENFPYFVIEYDMLNRRMKVIF